MTHATRYDTILMGNFFAFPQFTEKFGFYVPEKKKWEVEGKWQVALNMGSTVGGIFGKRRSPSRPSAGQGELIRNQVVS